MIRYALAGLMVIAMAGVASADHKTTHNPGGEPVAEGPPNLVLVDSDPLGPNDIGPVINLELNSVRVILETLDSQGETILIAPLVPSSGFNFGPSSAGPFFLTSECSEQAYFVFRGEGSTQAATIFPPFLRALIAPTPGGAISLYVATSENEELIEAPNFRHTPTGCELWGNPQLTVLPAELVYPDFHTTFPPPYTIEFR